MYYFCNLGNRNNERKTNTRSKPDAQTFNGGPPGSLGSPGGPASAGGIREAGSILGSGRSLGGGNGTLLQYSCQNNPMDRGAWWATVHGVSKSQTRLSI